VNRAYPAVSAAIERCTQVLGQERMAVVSSLSRILSVLTLPWDDDVTSLWEAVTAYPDKCDVELSRTEQHAYDALVGRIDRLWSLGRPANRSRQDVATRRAAVPTAGDEAELRERPGSTVSSPQTRRHIAAVRPEHDRANLLR
jgi:hypothetical protein